MSYAEKLKNPKWQKKRLEILQRDEFKCCYCNDTETELQIHHLKYTKEPWQAPNEDLITLCKHCHSVVSKFKYLKVIAIEKNSHGDDIFTISVKHNSNGLFNIVIYEIINSEINFIVEFLINGKLHNSILKLTS